MLFVEFKGKFVNIFISLSVFNSLNLQVNVFTKITYAWVDKTTQKNEEGVRKVIHTFFHAMWKQIGKQENYGMSDDVITKK